MSRVRPSGCVPDTSPSLPSESEHEEREVSCEFHTQVQMATRDSEHACCVRLGLFRADPAWGQSTREGDRNHLPGEPGMQRNGIKSFRPQPNAITGMAGSLKFFTTGLFVGLELLDCFTEVCLTFTFTSVVRIVPVLMDSLRCSFRPSCCCRCSRRSFLLIFQADGFHNEGVRLAELSSSLKRPDGSHRKGV